MSTACLDPFAALENLARRQTAERDAAKALSMAVCKLIRGKDHGKKLQGATFFASLAFGLKRVPDWDMPTMATDGKSPYYNPGFVVAQRPAQLIGDVCHEVMHPAQGHHARRRGRDPKRWNIACDGAINPAIVAAGYELSDGVVFPSKGPLAGMPEGLSAEDYYNRLPVDPNDKGEPGDDPGGCGAVLDAGDQAACQAAEAEYKVKVAQAAAAAKQRGELPAGIASMVEEILNPEVPWSDVLREFVSRSVEARDDYSWETPDRCYLQNGLYLPELRSEGLGHIVVHVDCSGSTHEFIAQFAGELNGVLECKPCRVTILYGDAELQGEPVEWTPGDGELTMERRGGGGTNHAHLADWIEEQADEPSCVVALTDGFTSWPHDYRVPTLWCITPGGCADVPFGRVVHLN